MRCTTVSRLVSFLSLSLATAPLCVAAAPVLQAQPAAIGTPPDPAMPSILVGSPAPSLKVEKWLKGDPVSSFQPGRIYVVEFWATWCGPCIETMPHLSELQEKYKASATFIGVSIREGGPKDDTYDAAVITRVADFVKKNDANMRYTVAFDGAARHMRTAWADAAGESGIPTAFVVDGSGRIAYIGHPAVPKMEQVLDQLVAKTFDMAAAESAYRQRIIEKAEFTKALALFPAGKPDQAVAALDALVAKSPKWAKSVAIEKFRGLIDAKRTMQAFDVVPDLIDTHIADDGQLLCAVADTIVELPDADRKPGLPLALRAAQRAVELNTSNYPVPPSVLASVHWAMGNRAEAIKWQRKAVELAPEEAKKNFAPKLAEYEAAK